MKPGDLVSIDWLDSGLRIMDSDEHEALSSQLAVVTVWGRVIHADDDTVLIAQEVDEDGHGQYGLVWRPSIQRVQYLEPGDDLDDVIESIVHEVESQSKRPEPKPGSTRSSVIRLD